eukprot:m.6996 g.6996  ORF g.6996 m.6996 type:complete len:325 (-) comp2689_c0_seq1:175-1149(-)
MSNQLLLDEDGDKRSRKKFIGMKRLNKVGATLIPKDAAVQNIKGERHFVFNSQNMNNFDGSRNLSGKKYMKYSDDEDDGDDDNDEAGGTKLSIRRTMGSNSGGNYNIEGVNTTTTTNSSQKAFILHQVEDHHTLNGIALQYRASVDEIKRLNNIWGEGELHARKTIKIPTLRHGYLYAAVMESNIDAIDGIDNSILTHTTKNPVMPTKLSADDKKSSSHHHIPLEAFIVETIEDEEKKFGAPEDSTASSSHNILAKFDEQLQEVIANQEALEENTTASGHNVVGIHRRKNTWASWYPQHWTQVVAALLIIVIVVPIAAYKFYDS